MSPINTVWIICGIYNFIVLFNFAYEHKDKNINWDFVIYYAFGAFIFGPIATILILLDKLIKDRE